MAEPTRRPALECCASYNRQIVMNEINYSVMLRHLVDDYFEHRLSRVEYIAQRRSLLDRIDYEFNGDLNSNGWPEPDATQPVDITDTSVKTIARDANSPGDDSP